MWKQETFTIQAVLNLTHMLSFTENKDIQVTYISIFYPELFDILLKNRILSDNKIAENLSGCRKFDRRKMFSA